MKQRHSCLWFVSGIAVHPLMHLNELLHQTQPTDRSSSVSRIKKKAESSL